MSPSPSLQKSVQMVPKVVMLDIVGAVVPFITTEVGVEELASSVVGTFVAEERSIHVEVVEPDPSKDGQLAESGDPPNPQIMIGKKPAQVVRGCDLSESDQLIRRGDRSFAVELVLIEVQSVSKMRAIDDLFEDQAPHLADESQRDESGGPLQRDHDVYEVEVLEDLAWWEKAGLKEDPIESLENMMPKGFSERSVLFL